MNYNSARNLVKNNNLQQFRKQNELSQKDICEELKKLGLEIDRSTYSKYEEGRRKIPYEVLILLAHYYKISLDDFFNFDSFLTL